MSYLLCTQPGNEGSWTTSSTGGQIHMDKQWLWQWYE